MTTTERPFAIVTGASSGIGYELAVARARERMSAQGNSRLAVRFAARAVEAEESVAILRNVLLSSTVLDLSEDDLHDDEASDNAADPTA